MRTTILTGLVGLWTACASVFGQRPYGNDVSHYQGTLSQTAWNNCKAAGRTFAMTKADEGVNNSLNDSTLTTNMSRARAAGIYIGAYHFARPETNAAVPEADHFYSLASAYMTSGYLRPMLDLESDGSAANVTYLSNWVNDFCNEVKLKSGVECTVYCNTNYASNYLDSTVASRTLWVANYPTTPNPQTGDPGTGVWAEWDFWQWTDADTGSGLSSSGVDGDVFHNLAGRPPLDAHVIPSIVRSPSTLSRSVVKGLDAASQTFTIKNNISGIAVPLHYVISSNASWLSATPSSSSSGLSAGSTDTITTNYDTSGLAIGTYTGTLTLTNAGNTSWFNFPTIVVTITVKAQPGDLNNDGKVNDLDVSAFVACMTGSNHGPPGSGCTVADMDGDNDVDMSDFAKLQHCLNGNLSPDPQCAD